MNIFYLAECPIEAAFAQCNKHIVKMTLESGQMLSTAHRVLDGTLTEVVRRSDGKRFKRHILPKYGERAGMFMDERCTIYWETHVNHPCNMWIRASLDNYNWLYEHFIALGSEYTERYGKVHKCIRENQEIFKNPPESLKSNGFTHPPQCMPDECKHEDTVRAYNKYYMFKNKEWTEQGSPMVWT